jgi:glycosyltransferase involved in cell wall biosynthesis
VTRALCARGAFVPDAIIANSWAGRRAHEALGYRARRWIHCPNGLDLDWFRPDAALRAEGRRALGVNEGDVVIGLVARVDPMKDHQTFVAAARLLARRVPRARFLAVGTGATSSPLLDAAAADPDLGARLIRREASDDLRPLYGALDVATLTSSFGEGFPNVVAEAMACGVPVVSTNVGDAAHIVGETGTIVRIGDSGALAAAWEELAGADPSRRLALGRAARQRIASEFNLEDVAGRFRTYLEALSIAGRGGPLPAD